MSESEKDRQIADAQGVANARIQAQQTEIARANITGGGATAQLQRELAGEEVTAGVVASRDVEAASRQQEKERFGVLQQQLLQKSLEDKGARASLQDFQKRQLNSAMASISSFISSGSAGALLAGLGQGDSADLSAEDLSALNEAMTEKGFGEFNPEDFQDVSQHEGLV